MAVRINWNIQSGAHDSDGQNRRMLYLTAWADGDESFAESLDELLETVRRSVVLLDRMIAPSLDDYVEETVGDVPEAFRAAYETRLPSPHHRESNLELPPLARGKLFWVENQGWYDKLVFICGDCNQETPVNISNRMSSRKLYTLDNAVRDAVEQSVQAHLENCSPYQERTSGTSQEATSGVVSEESE